jgi:hypothetical protein
MRKTLMILGLVVLVGIIGGVLIRWCPPGPGGGGLGGWGEETEAITWTDYHPPPPAAKPLVVDDRPEDKATTFDSGLVDRRPEGQWLVNLSEAVVRLDAPMILPDVEPALLVLHPSYAAAIAASGAGGDEVLPSVNMADGKAKQFDDGLVAALEQAILRGRSPKLPNPISVIKRLFGGVGPDSPAAPFLAAGLSLIGEDVVPAPAAEKKKTRWLAAFAANEVLSKPIGFFTWNKTLSDGYRFRRFFQQAFDGREPAIPRALAAVLGRDPELRDDYRRVVAFDSGLTSRPACLSLIDLLDGDNAPAPGQVVALFPPSGSREEGLFSRLFPLGLPSGADLMRALIARIRSGEVDLAPGEGSGWYDHQVHALETLLLPEKGAESRKLLLTGSYKLRMLEAFKALMTKRRETHVLGLKTAETTMAPAPPQRIAPRLRVEPCPSFYLRTARAYAFLATFLDSAVGADVLESLHGLREGGERPPDLRAELASMRDLFYGLALLSSEDIGMRADLRADEPVDRDHCERLASGWLAHAREDPDLGVDTRVSVPIYADPGRRVTRLWATLGVRLTRITASFARAPRIRPVDGKQSDGWQVVEPYRLGPSSYLIPVDEFAEAELRGNRVLTRSELRDICDARKSKEAIVSALER